MTNGPSANCTALSTRLSVIPLTLFCWSSTSSSSAMTRACARWKLWNEKMREYSLPESHNHNPIRQMMWGHFRVTDTID
jgi:hypothetical protein